MSNPVCLAKCYETRQCLEFIKQREPDLVQVHIPADGSPFLLLGFITHYCEVFTLRDPRSGSLLVSVYDQESSQGIIRVQAPQFSKVSMAVQLTEELQAADLLTRFLSQDR